MNQRGQALIEVGLVLTVLILLVVGIVELGRVWMVLTTVHHALRDGARSAATAPTSTGRDPNGVLLARTSTAIRALVLDEISAAMDTDGLAVRVNQGTQGAVPIVTVHVTGAIPLVFGLFGANLPLDRSVTFRDGGR